MAIISDSKERIQKGSVHYVRDNKADVTRLNQRVLVGLNVFYLIVLVLYYLASLTVFSEWHVSGLYKFAAILQAVCVVYILIRFGWSSRTYREVNVMCTLFQLYAMAFVGVMCIVPVEMNQPAVYYAPIAMAFAAAFVFTYNHSIMLIGIELMGYLIASIVFKSKEVVAIDCSSCILAFLMAVFLIRILYTQRIRENESRQRIRRMGMVDALTGLYNKASTEFLSKGFLKSEPQQACALMILDFDDFKNVNDTYGHQAGDVVLRSFGRILKRQAGDEHIAGRIGGDEFFLFLKGVTVSEAEECAQQILAQTRQLVSQDGKRIFSCSIGVSIKHPYEDKASASEQYKDLFARADQVLYQVKKNGKNNYMIES